MPSADTVERIQTLGADIENIIQANNKEVGHRLCKMYMVRGWMFSMEVFFLFFSPASVHLRAEVGVVQHDSYVVFG